MFWKGKKCKLLNIWPLRERRRYHHNAPFRPYFNKFGEREHYITLHRFRSLMDTLEESVAPSVETARKRLYEAVNRGFSENYPVLIDALPSVGKSYGVIKWAAVSGNPLTIGSSHRF